eukprot:TRINITY_DN1633_c0_g4_i2.p1 TRINITY_DN1633_c0_g4~~TRINITY_DN1633_c0_g4_i2.p1  ORF type:complete len:366 (-),score=34.80 TRINITY_DN1633_c0_g4_i2:52-1149(-)
MCIRDRQSTWGTKEKFEMSEQPSKSQVKIQVQIGDENIDLTSSVPNISNLQRLQAIIRATNTLNQFPNLDKIEKEVQPDQSNDSLYDFYSTQIDVALDNLISDLTRILNKERVKLKQELITFLHKRKNVINDHGSYFQDNTKDNAQNTKEVSFQSLWQDYLDFQQKFKENLNLSELGQINQLVERHLSLIKPDKVFSLKWTNDEGIFNKVNHSISSPLLSIPFTAHLQIRNNQNDGIRIGLVDRSLPLSLVQNHNITSQTCNSRALIYSSDYSLRREYGHYYESYTANFYFRKINNSIEGQKAYQAPRNSFKLQIKVDINRLCRLFIDDKLEYEYSLPEDFIPHLYAQSEKGTLEVEIVQLIAKK